MKRSNNDGETPEGSRRKRARQQVNYAESSGGEDTENGQYNDSESEGGFIVPEKKTRNKSRSSTTTPSTARSTRRNSKQSTPGTSSVSGDENMDDLSILDKPMSSSLAKDLFNSKKKGKKKEIVIDSDDDSDEDYKVTIELDDDEDDDNEEPGSELEEKEAPKRKRKQSQSSNATKAKRKPRKKKEADNRPRYEKYHENLDKDLIQFHPEVENIFEQLKGVPPIEVEQAEQPEDLSVRLLPFQKEGINWLQKQEQSIYRGAILADEMGMGKTIQTVALIMSDTDRVGPNLVVAPTVAMMQWKNEIDLYTNGKLKVYLFYGTSRTANQADLDGYDVVLTTYAVCESVYRKQVSGFRRKSGLVKEKSVLHNMMFHRIVLDEAHNIKDRTSNTARAVSTIQSVYKICLSGTPLQNRIGEIYSLLRFLKVEPFCNYLCRKCDCKLSEWTFSDYRSCDSCGHRVMDHPNFFNHSILKFIQRTYTKVSSTDAMNNLRTLLRQIMLRRTKLERADDLGLPPRIVQVRRDYFNAEERDLYASVYGDSNRAFNSYVNEGVVLNNYANIFTLITRMRQVADHPDLVLRRKQEGDNARAALVCKLCDDEAEEAIRSKCHHTFCRLCIKEYVEGWTGDEKQLECPVCHVHLNIDLEAPAIEVDQEEVKKGSIVNRIDMSGNWRSSTKIEALVEELFKLRSDRQTIKSIVFSQFTSMLDLVEWRLNKAGFQCVKLQGSMSPSQRDGIIRHFMETPSVEIFLVSLKAGGVALNLCEASQVFILDPWWNPSVEWQSGDRVHRIGQHRPVQITRLAIEDSIESRIIELQEKKASMIHATIGNDDASMNRLTPADMQFLFMN